MIMSLEDAWAGGFIEGEGCLRLASRKDTAVVELCVGQKFRPALDRLQECIGIGKVYGPYDHKGSSKQFSYVLRGPALGGVLRRILPYLVEKRPQAELLLGFLEQQAHYRAKRGRGTRCEEELSFIAETARKCSDMKKESHA